MFPSMIIFIHAQNVKATQVGSKPGFRNGVHKLAIVKSCGVLIFKVDHDMLRLQP